jgi:excinuclease UvrABC helicase subunit UvrB
MLLEHNITTRTPLPIQSTTITPTATDGIIEIEDDNTVIRQFLRNKGLSCPRADTKGATTKIRNILFNYAKQQNKRVVYGFLPSVPVEDGST